MPPAPRHQISAFGGAWAALAVLSVAGLCGVRASEPGLLGLWELNGFLPAYTGVSREKTDEAARGSRMSPGTYYCDHVSPTDTQTGSQVSWIILDLPLKSCSGPFRCLNPRVSLIPYWLPIAGFIYALFSRARHHPPECTYKKTGLEMSDATHINPGIWT